jgi:hypothetical protein
MTPSTITTTKRLGWLWLTLVAAREIRADR